MVCFLWRLICRSEQRLTPFPNWQGFSTTSEWLEVGFLQGHKYSNARQIQRALLFFYPNTEAVTRLLQPLILPTQYSSECSPPPQSRQDRNCQMEALQACLILVWSLKMLHPRCNQRHLSGAYPIPPEQ